MLFMKKKLKGRQFISGQLPFNMRCGPASAGDNRCISRFVVFAIVVVVVIPMVNLLPHHYHPCGHIIQRTYLLLLLFCLSRYSPLIINATATTIDSTTTITVKCTSPITTSPPCCFSCCKLHHSTLRLVPHYLTVAIVTTRWQRRQRQRHKLSHDVYRFLDIHEQIADDTYEWVCKTVAKSAQTTCERTFSCAQKGKGDTSGTFWSGRGRKWCEKQRGGDEHTCCALQVYGRWPNQMK